MPFLVPRGNERSRAPLYAMPSNDDECMHIGHLFESKNNKQLRRVYCTVHCGDGMRLQLCITYFNRVVYCCRCTAVRFWRRMDICCWKNKMHIGCIEQHRLGWCSLLVPVCLCIHPDSTTAIDAPIAPLHDCTCMHILFGVVYVNIVLWLCKWSIMLNVKCKPWNCIASMRSRSWHMLDDDRMYYTTQQQHVFVYWMKWKWLDGVMHYVLLLILYIIWWWTEMDKMAVCQKPIDWQATNVKLIKAKYLSDK